MKERFAFGPIGQDNIYRSIELDMGREPPSPCTDNASLSDLGNDLLHLLSPFLQF
jgi:hypothetical protein